MRTWCVSSKSPIPKSELPALLETTVRFFVPARRSGGDQIFGNAAEAEAAHQDRGAVAQCVALASSALATRLSIGVSIIWRRSDAIL